MKKRKDGRYSRQIVIGIQENGKPKKKTLYAKTIKDLDAKEREFRNLMDKGIAISTNNITVNDLIKAWKKKKQSLSVESVRGIERDTKKISASIGIMKVSDVKLFHLEEFKDELCSSLSGSSAKLVIIRLKELFKYAVEKEMIIKNPAEFLEMPRKIEPIKRMLTDHEKSLIENTPLSDMEKCFTYLLRYTGMRRGEILALHTTDIDLKLKIIQVNKTLEDGRGKPFIKNSPKTEAGIRNIPIFDPLYQVLKEYCSGRVGLLFSNKNGNYVNSKWIHDTWKEIKEKLRIANNGVPIADDITPHMFRHTFASDLYDAGIDIKRAQYILGHSDIKTTLAIYTHFDKTKMKVDEMNEYYKQSKNSQQNINTAQAL